MYAQDLWQILQQALLQRLMDARGGKRDPAHLSDLFQVLANCGTTAGL